MTNAEHPIRYRVNPVDPAGHLFEIDCIVDRPDPAGQVLSMAAWIPGSYMVRDFARNVLELRAEAGGRPVAMEKLDKQTWRCAPCDGPLTLTYRVYAWDLSVRGAHLDRTHGYFNGTSLFMKVHGQEETPCAVDLEPPEDPACRDWGVATSLPAAEETPAWGFGRHRAAGYEDLIDHPVEMGTFDLVQFDAGGIPHAMAITGRHHADKQRLARDLKRVCEQHIAFFGGEPPFPSYLFLLTVVGDGYGGLEHRDSSSLMCSREDLPRSGVDTVEEGYREFLGLCSHEYFHAWNVKRLRPAAFQPFDLSAEVHTPLLWAFEGITSYYDELALVRAGLIDADSYLELLGRTITRVHRAAGRFRQSVAESSFDAWTRFYKQDENAPNAIVSYYAKGALVALALDLTLRRDSGGQVSLDEVMRALWQRHGAPEIGIEQADFEAVVGELAGRDMTPFFDQAVRGTEDLPLTELLAGVGVSLQRRPATSEDDRGGTPPPDPSKPARRVSLGVRTGDDPLGAKVLVVFEGTTAHAAGLAAGDIIIAVEGLRATRSNLEALLGHYWPGDAVTLHAFRRDELLPLEATLQAPAEDTYYLVREDETDAATAEARAAWLGGG